MARGRTPRGTAAGGQTLIELVAVMGIMSVVLLLALPRADPWRQAAVDTAAKEVAQALRFAQMDAIRTGDYRVVSIDSANGMVRVFGLDMGPTPPVENLANPVAHPVDKKKYDLVFADKTATSGIAISASFTYTDNITLAQVVFNTDGVPVKVNGPNAPDVKPLKATGVIQVVSGSFQRSLNVDVGTGRVTLLQS